MKKESYNLESLEEIKARNRSNDTSFTVEQREKLQKAAGEIIKRRETKEREMRRAELEHLYELGLYA